LKSESDDQSGHRRFEVICACLGLTILLSFLAKSAGDEAGLPACPQLAGNTDAGIRCGELL
jgi:hypothetical protein